MHLRVRSFASFWPAFSGGCRLHIRIIYLEVKRVSFQRMFNCGVLGWRGTSCALIVSGASQTTFWPNRIQTFDRPHALKWFKRFHTSHWVLTFTIFLLEHVLGQHRANPSTQFRIWMVYLCSAADLEYLIELLNVSFGGHIFNCLFNRFWAWIHFKHRSRLNSFSLV